MASWLPGRCGRLPKRVGMLLFLCSLWIKNQKWAWFSSQLQRWMLEQTLVSLTLLALKRPQRSLGDRINQVKIDPTAKENPWFPCQRTLKESPQLHLNNSSCSLDVSPIVLPVSSTFQTWQAYHWGVRGSSQWKVFWVGWWPLASLLGSKGVNVLELQLEGGMACGIHSPQCPWPLPREASPVTVHKAPHPTGLFYFLHSPASCNQLSYYPFPPGT